MVNLNENYWLNKLGEEEFKRRYYAEELFEPLLPFQRLLLWVFISFIFLSIVLAIRSVT